MVLRDDANDAIRREWFDLEEEAMLALAERIEREVHAVDPGQGIGLMSVGARIHSAEGRHTDRLLRALSGTGVRPMLRPGAGFWHDWQPGDVLIKTEEVARQIEFLGRDVRAVAEIENHPYSPFQKSLRVLRLELGLEVLAGASDLSLNILNSTAPLCRGDVDYAEFLQHQRTFLDQLALARAGKIRLGVGVESSEEVARRMPLRGRPLMAWVEPRPWEATLARLGLPVGQPHGAPHLLAGDIVYAMDRYALESALQEGAVLTPSAVQAVLSLGWGERLGVRQVSTASGANESLTTDPLNGTHAGARLPVRHYAGVLGPHTFGLVEEKTCRVLSRWVDVDGIDRGVAAAGIELDGGIRLGLLPFEIETVAHTLLHPARRVQWAGLFEWVSRRPLPCRVVGGVNLCPQLLVDPNEGNVLLAVANLSADDAVAHPSGPVLRRAGSAWRLTPAGAWVVERTPSRVEIAAWSLAVLRW